MILSGAAMTSAVYAESYGFRNEKGLSYPVAAAYDNKYTNIQWQTEAAENTGVPVPYGESVLLPKGQEILRLSETDGTQMAAIKLPETVSESCSGVMYGNTLVQPTKSGISLIDFTNGEVTASRTFDGDIDSNCAVIDDMAYFSVETDGTETFYCVDLKEQLKDIWSYSADAEITSPTVQRDLVIFGAGDKLVTHHYKDESFAEIPLGAEISGAPFASQYAVFYTDTDGNVCKLRLNDDGTMEEDTLTKCAVGASPSSPLERAGKLYVSSETGLHILDSVNMEISHSFDTIKKGSDPFVCYGNGQRVYCVGLNEGKWELHCILDEGEDNAPTDEILAIMENYESGRSAVSANATLYFRDGIGRLYALTKIEYDIVSIVFKLIILLLIIAGIFLWIRMIGKRRAANNPRY